MPLSEAVSHGLAFDPESMGVSFVNLSWEALILVAPIFLATIAAALLTSVAFALDVESEFVGGTWLIVEETAQPLRRRVDTASSCIGVSPAPTFCFCGALVYSSASYNVRVRNSTKASAVDISSNIWPART